jgi:hypothetical protein
MQDYYESAESVEARAIMRLVSLGTTTLDVSSRMKNLGPNVSID